MKTGIHPTNHRPVIFEDVSNGKQFLISTTAATTEKAKWTDGQEYDGLVFLATKFFDEYGGSTRSNMVSIGVHEIAHQWWFGLVGNDQALEPWLDEAMSVYSEKI